MSSETYVDGDYNGKLYILRSQLEQGQTGWTVRTGTYRFHRGSRGLSTDRWEAHLAQPPSPLIREEHASRWIITDRGEVFFFRQYWRKYEDPLADILL